MRSRLVIAALALALGAPSGAAPATAADGGGWLPTLAPYALGVWRGLRVTGLSAGAQHSPVVTCTVDCFYGGDLAAGNVSYVLR